MDEGYGQGTLHGRSGRRRGPTAGPRRELAQPAAELVGDRRMAGGGQTLTFQRKNMQALAGLGGIIGRTDAARVSDLRPPRRDRALTRMSRLPANRRKATLKATLDKVDPTLYGRAMKLADQYNRQGMPANQAVHQGLANAMATGIAAENRQHGSHADRTPGKLAPGPGVLWRQGRLGSGFGGHHRHVSNRADHMPPPAGYTWNAATSAFERLKVGAAPVNGPCGATVTTNDQRGVSTAGGITPYHYLQSGR